ncbi:hypothetical protein VOLCADRAFT_103797 [Volvox carteri f. nagariensis]|uniref:Golgi apparatus protein 1 n=1 Tax=Volvox carteri f. nagariensis TaxID=3068 RepID=D8TP96_VOLCA|nr:uncharacterized protein VOLCADRAFT_103797 [Volvox carteri f. nagariensis]EFJ50582.1 hypothetical protein VOLCADRAFT_103797 [Volvox carteri f. nagariensis]|eukprot:XP_002948175.1 hypothetical protein VOLCADRAFT_103797 [Volvox carteri f. nagariensis]
MQPTTLRMNPSRWSARDGIQNIRELGSMYLNVGYRAVHIFRTSWPLERRAPPWPQPVAPTILIGAGSAIGTRLPVSLTLGLTLLVCIALQAHADGDSTVAVTPATAAANSISAATKVDDSKQVSDADAAKPAAGAVTSATASGTGEQQVGAGEEADKPAETKAAETESPKDEATKAEPVKEETTDAGEDKEVVTAKSTEDKPAAGTTKRQKVTPYESKVIDFAPAANITFGDDIDDEGKCAKEIEIYCDDVDEGEGKLADCISEQIAATEVPESTDDVPEISDECREEVYAFKVHRNSNINANVPLAKACKVDADKFCNVTWFFGYKSGQVIACLRDMKAQVSKPCKQQLFKVMLEAAVDIQADPMLYEACKEDSENLCKGVKNGGGRIQACLRDKRMQLSWACEEQLFRQEMENADDIRLSFCKDIEPGNARTKDCLEENREQLSSACKEEVDSMIERRVRDFRLDSRLRNVCENEIFNMCAYFGDLDDMDTYDSSVINCLQDYADEIKNAQCKSQVKKYLQLASQDIRFDVPLAEACFEDRQKFCADVPPGSARVIRCLSNNRERLSPVCRATLFDEEVRFSENIDFQYPMKTACVKEIERFCKDVPHGSARVIRCLQDNKAEKDFGKACNDEVSAYEAEISKDYRFNYRLHKACQKEVDKLCPGLCQNNDGSPCGGKVLRCLTDKIEDIGDEACKKEVYYYEKMEVSNFMNDILLAEACRTDVELHCSKVEPGEGRVHKCLRDNRKKLTDACRREELLLEEKEANSIELNMSLLKACKAERQLFCSAVQPGQARVFRCLAENMNDADFGSSCKYQVVYKLQRRQANWKLDPPLRKACKADVLTYCANEDAANSEEGLVYKCMIKNYEALSDGCQKEVGRAVHMAFFVWQRGAIITSECDDDIDKLCLADRPNMAARPGAVGTCLATLLERQDRASARLLQATTSDAALTPACARLADIAEPPNMKAAFESSLTFALLKDQLEAIEVATGLPTLTRDRLGNPQGVSLTGSMAMMGVTALVVLIIYGVYAGYRRLRGGNDRDYTLVVKQQHK